MIIHDYFMAVVFSVMLIAAPFLFAKAWRRKDNRRIFDMICCLIVLFGLNVDRGNFPLVVKLPHLVRILLTGIWLVSALSTFGLSTFLFREKKQADI